MGKNITYTRFCRFLKEKGIYVKFIKEFNKPFQTDVRISWLNTAGDKTCKPIVSHHNISEFCYKLSDKRLIINYAFSWRDTEEGYEFWNSLANDWQDKYPMWENYFNIK